MTSGGYGQGWVGVIDREWLVSVKEKSSKKRKKKKERKKQRYNTNQTEHSSSQV